MNYREERNNTAISPATTPTPLISAPLSALPTYTHKCIHAHTPINRKKEKRVEEEQKVRKNEQTNEQTNEVEKEER